MSARANKRNKTIRFTKPTDMELDLIDDGTHVWFWVPMLMLVGNNYKKRKRVVEMLLPTIDLSQIAPGGMRWKKR